MVQSFWKFLKSLEQWEKYKSSSFWFCTIGLWFIINSFSFDALSPPSEVPCESQVVVGQLRGGGSKDKPGVVRKVTAFLNPWSRQRPQPRRQPQRQPQCPATYPKRRGAPGSGSNSPWDDSDPNSGQKMTPPRAQWNSDAKFYRYDENENKKDDSQQEQTPIDGQCKPRVLKSRINEDPGLIRAAEKACKNQEVQADINAMEEQIRQGNMNPGIGSKPVGGGITEFRGANGGRILARESENGVIEILGKSGKGKKNQKYVINRVKQVFPKNQK